uniref:Uncharacterized protein n=1 Tax=Tanacetum cinerariifolium TaxID=118510 RepID=A0A6L2J615_TANCI|nr:hypothetical protein [Tanacetum cinerariifolium]
MFRSVPAVESRSVPAIESRSVPGVESRSVPAVKSRSVPDVESKLVPAVESRSVPVVVSRSVPVVESRSVPAVVSGGVEAALHLKTTEQKIARINELKAKSTLLLAIPDEHLLKFHVIKDAKTLWEAIKTRFGGNKEYKKMQKTILKQQYENFAASRSESLDKTYDMFQKLIIQLKIHDNTSSTNEAVNTAHDVSAASLQGQAFASTYADDIMFSFFANQSNSPQLDNEELEQIDTDDFEEMDLKWQVAMLTMRVKRFIKKTGSNINFNGKETIRFNKTKVECYNCHRRVKTPVKALVFIDGMGYDWSYQAEKGPTDFALMAFSSSGSSSSDTEVNTCSKECLKSYQALQKQYDQQCKILNKANIEIIAYQLGLESLEARIVVHHKNEVVFEEDVAFLEYDVKVRDNSITELKNQLEESLKEKDDLKLKLEKFETSSKNLTNLINSQISPKDKTGLGYESQLNERDLNNKSDVFESASDSSLNKSKEDNNQATDRYKASEGYHAVPPLYIGNFMPLRPDLSFAGLDDSVFKFAISETVTSVHKTKTSASKTSKECMEKPKSVRPSAPIIKDWESDCDGDCKVPVNTAKQSSPRAAASISTVRYVNTVATRPTMNGAKPSLNVFHKSHSLVRRTFNQRTAPKNSDLKETINTAKGNPQYPLQDQGIFDSGCSRHIKGNKSFLTDYKEIDGGFVAFGESHKGDKISRKGKIRTGKLKFEDVYVVKELKFNLYSVLQMCDKKNNVLFTETECLVLSPDFKLLDENQVLLKVPRQNNMYSFDLKNVAPLGEVCLQRFLKMTIHVLPVKKESNTKPHAEAVNTACYVQNRVLVTKPHNKTPYELLIGRSPNLDFMRPFGCPVTILNTLDHLGKFEGKDDEGLGPERIFDIDSLTQSMNYEPVTIGNQTNDAAGIEINVNAGQARQEKAFDHEYILLPFMPFHSPLSLSIQSSDDKDVDEAPGKGDEGVSKGSGVNNQERFDSSTQDVNTAKPSINTANTNINTGSLNINIVGSNDPSIPSLKEIDIFEMYMMIEKIEAIRLFLAYASFMGFIVYQMDVKSAFLYGTIEEEVGTIDKILFIKKDIDDILLVQVYVDDIICGSTKKSLCDAFEQMMHKRFQMSSMGEFTFFLGLQVKQKDDGFFISQDKYVADILKKFAFAIIKTASTPMEPNKALIKDAEAKDVDVHLYRSMIGSLMYLTASRPDIMFAVCACARFQVTPKTSHLYAVKRIFRYLKGQPKLGLWYPRDSSFNLKAFSNSDYARASLNRKYTTGGCQFLGKRLILWQCKKQTIVANSTTKVEYVAAASCCGQAYTYYCKIKVNVATPKLTTAGEDGKKIIITEASIRRDLRLDDVEGTACLPNAAIFEELARMGAKTTAWNEFNITMASAIIYLANNQKFNFTKYIFDNMVKNLEAGVKFYMFPRFVQMFVNHQLGDISHHKGIFINPSLTKKRKHKSRRKQRKEIEVPHTEPQPEEHIPTPSHDPLLSAKIKKLKKTVKKLEGKKKKRTHGLKRLYKVGLTSRVESFKEEEDQGRTNDEDLFGVNDLDGDELIMDVTASENVEQDATVIKKEVSAAANEVVTTVESIKAKPKAKEVTIQEPSEFKTTSPSQSSQPQHAKDKEEERIAREKNETNRAMIKEWDDVQATIDFDRQLAEQFQAQEREQLSIEERSKLLAKLIESRRKDFKGKSYDANKKMFDKVYKRVNTFVAIDLEVMEGSKKTQTEVTKGSSKRARDEIEQESANRQRLRKNLVMKSGSEDEEYDMAVRDFKKFFKRRECPKPPKDKNQRAFIGGSWSDSGEEDDDKVKNETCIVAQASSEVCFKSSYFSDENSSIDDLSLDNEYDKLCKMSLKIITKNKRLKATRNSLEKEISILKEKVSTLEKNKEVDLECVKCHMLKIENEKFKEEALKLRQFEKSTHCLNEMLNNQKPSSEKLGLGFNSFEASSSETKEIKFMKAQKKVSPDGGPINMDNPLNVQAPPKNVNEALGDESWIVDIQEELNQFVVNDVWELVPQPRNIKIIGTKWVFRNKLDKNGVVFQNKARLVAQGYNQQKGIDYEKTYAPVTRLESIRILLAYDCALYFKLFQMDVKSAFLNGFINEEVYVAQPPGFIDFEKPDRVYKLKKALYGLKQAPKAWPDIMFSVCLCARFQEAPKTSHLEAVKRTFRYIKGTTHLGLWYPKGTDIKTIVYADSDHTGDYVDQKSTSGICTFVRCCLTSWFSKKQTALAISNTEAKYGVCAFTDRWSLDELAYGVSSDGPYQTNPPSPYDIILSIQIDREAQLERKPRKDRGMRRGFHFTSSSIFNQPSLSHHNDDDDEIDEGTSRVSTPSLIRYVNSLTNEVLQVFQNPPNIDPHLEHFYTRQTKIINRQVQIHDEHRGGIRSIGKGLRNLRRNMKK